MRNDYIIAAKLSDQAFIEKFRLLIGKEDDRGCRPWTGVSGGSANRPNAKYGRFQITFEGRTTRLRAHRVSWCIANNAIPPEGFFVCHKCDNTICVSPDHLFIGDQIANCHDMVAKGRHARGERQHRAILSSSDVACIKAKLEIGTLHSVLASEYGVNRRTIGAIKSGRNWRHIHPDTFSMISLIKSS